MASRSVSYPHYAWAREWINQHSLKLQLTLHTITVGHFAVLLGTIYTLLGLVTFSSRSNSYYISYGGAIISWGIVVVRLPSAPLTTLQNEPRGSSVR